METESDEVLLGRVRAGSREALAQLYQRYSQRLYAFCYRLLANSAHAEDAVHDTFVRICDGVHTLQKAQAFQAWIFRIARNESLMKLRRRRESSNNGIEDLWDDTTPLSILTKQDTAEIVQQSMEKLKIEYREVLFLREIEQLSYADIATITGATESSVKSRIFKARKALGEKLKPWFMEGTES